MPQVPADTFDQQLTATLKVKGVKKLSDLQRYYQNLTDGLDNHQALFEQGGQQSREGYEKAKNLTLRLKKRDGDFSELVKMWNEAESKGLETAIAHQQQQQQHQPQQQEGGATSPISTKSGSGKSVDVASMTGIETDEDLVMLMLALIQENFWNPDTGFWPGYDAQFDRSSFTCLGQAGWETADPSSPLREGMNRKKNAEVHEVMESEWVKQASQRVFDALIEQVVGVKKREVKHAVRNHVRMHLYKLIYGPN